MKIKVILLIVTLLAALSLQAGDGSAATEKPSLADCSKQPRRASLVIVKAGKTIDLGRLTRSCKRKVG